MTRSRPVTIITALLLSGCSIMGGGDNAPTIGDLSKRSVTMADVPVESSEKQAMNAYRNFLATDDDTDARPHAMRRLADINLEAEVLPQADFDSDRAVSLYPQQVQDSITLYQRVLKNYPQRENNDSVLYQLARAYELGGEPDKSLATMAQLVRQYPDSKHWLEARFRRGEILFVQKKYRAAENSYQAVVAAGKASPFHEQALYKLGWSFFKQGMFTEGLDAFTALLDLKIDNTLAGDQRLAQLSRAARERVDDTLRVISLSFSYEQGAKSVADYFTRKGGRPYEDIVYDRLGMLYLGKERFNDAAETFNAFVEQNPYHAQAPAFQMRVIETYRQGKFPTLVLQGKKDFVDRYNLHSDYWQHHDPAASEQVMGFLKVTMTDLSRHYHALAQKHRKPADYAEATHWYRSFLGSFPQDKAAPDMNFLLAELLFESGQYAAAADEYVITAYNYDTHDKAADAGYTSILARNKHETTLQGTVQQAWHEQSIENALRFATSFPEHPQSLAVLTRSAEQLLAIHRNQRAIEVAQAVIDNPAATTTQQRVTWTVQAHAYFDLEDYLHAEQAYQQVLTRTAANDENKPVLIERLAASIYKQGEAEQGAGDTAAAVGHFQRVRAAAPTASIVATAEYDAAAGLLQLQDWQAAAGMLEQFRGAFPDDPRQGEVTRRLATAYLSSDQPLQAATEFERIGREHADADLRRDALWQAAELYTRADRSTQSNNMYSEYIRQFPQPFEPAIEARHRIAKQYKSAGATGDYHRVLADIIASNRKAGNGRTERTRYLAAHAQLTLARVQYARYRGARLTLPLKQTLETKKRLMQEALQQFEQAAGYQVAAVTTAAAFFTAEIYSHLATALMQSERPKNLDAEALEQYDILLEDQAYPFEEQAITLHETNAARLEAGHYDAWIGKSLQVLAQLVPAQYAKHERGASHVAELR
ncbi:MAG: tetratricopeptide repeat protein [Gammaproteobacteria bacterium]